MTIRNNRGKIDFWRTQDEGSAPENDYRPTCADRYIPDSDTFDVILWALTPYRHSHTHVRDYLLSRV